MLNEGKQPSDFMKEALLEAQKALEEGEVPVGVVIEKDGVIIGRGHNRTEGAKILPHTEKSKPFVRLPKLWTAGD